MVPVISFVGRHNSGKTGVVVDVVRTLAAEGHRVGVIKHSSQHFDIDVPNKDSYRIASAGAKVMAVSSASRFALYRDVETEVTLDEMVAMTEKDVDIIITEGYKQAGYPKIEVARRGISTDLIMPYNLRAVITDFDVDEQIGVRVFDFSEIEEITQFIISEFLSNNGENGLNE